MATVRIQTKFLALVLGILIISIGILSVVIVRRESRLLARKNAEQEHLLARTIVADLADSMLSGRPRSTLTLLKSLREVHGITRLDVLREDGSPAFGVKREGLTLPQIGQAFREGREMDLTFAGPPPTHTNLFPLRNEGACLRCHTRSGPVLGVILISHSLKETAEEIRESKRQLAFLLGGAVLVMGAALYLAIRKVVLAPVKALHGGAEAIGKGDLGHHITVTSGDEFEDLASAFNAMADQVKAGHSELENIVKLRTAELNESVRIMRGILASMSSGVILLDLEGRVKIINRQGAHLLGHPADRLIGKKLAEAVPDTAGFFIGRMGGYEEVEVRVRDTTVPLGFKVSPYPGGSAEQEGMIVVFQDQTELKFLQAELVNKERFASVGRVVAGVAHEIRNPLFGISAIGQLLERDLKDPAHQELLRALLGETKRLNQLVEELLIYGRPLKLKLEEADLRVLWEEVLEMHRQELTDKEVRVIGDYAVRHPVTQFDVHQVRQVFLNILRNAIEASVAGGVISITTLLEDKSILLQVADTGIGIPADQLEHVFDLFYTTKPKGTGLGLAICRKIMQDHGGDITINSTVGAGTTVTIKLPYHPEHEQRSGNA